MEPLNHSTDSPFTILACLGAMKEYSFHIHCYSHTIRFSVFHQSKSHRHVKWSMRPRWLYFVWCSCPMTAFDERFMVVKYYFAHLFPPIQKKRTPPCTPLTKHMPTDTQCASFLFPCLDTSDLDIDSEAYIVCSLCSPRFAQLPISFTSGPSVSSLRRRCPVMQLCHAAPLTFPLSFRLA